MRDVHDCAAVCRGAGHDEGKKYGSKGLPGRNYLSPLFAFSVWAVLHSEDVCEGAFAVVWLPQMVAFAAFAMLGRKVAHDTFARFRAHSRTQITHEY